MAQDGQGGALFRLCVPNQHSRVTCAELLFDLIFISLRSEP
jgi:low temperature requirement protein LtrA